MKRTIRNPQKFIGKKLNPGKWNLPESYVLCAKTGKLCKEADAIITFSHWMFNRKFLTANNIYVEDAQWLSEEGYDEIVAVLERTGKYDEYRSAFDHIQDYVEGRCEIAA